MNRCWWHSWYIDNDRLLWACEYCSKTQELSWEELGSLRAKIKLKAQIRLLKKNEEEANRPNRL